MKEIAAYTIHSAGGNVIASIICNKMNDEHKIVGMNIREEIIVEDEDAKRAEEKLRNYLNSKLVE